MATPSVRDVHRDAILTQFSVAYRNAEYIGEQIFPRVQVAKKSDFYYIFNPGAWFRDEVAVRAPGTKAALSDYTLSSASYVATQYAIATMVSDEVRENADSVLRPDVEGIEYVTDALLRAQERRIAAKVMGHSNWAYSASPTYQWSSDSSNPYEDIENAINGVVSTIGRMPNVAVMSWDVWRKLKNHPDLLDRIKYTRPGAKLEISDLTGWFGFQKVLIGMSLYDSAREGQSASKSYIWADDFWCGFVPPSAALLTPAAGYVLEWETRKINRYRLDEEHADKFEAIHATAEVTTASDAAAIVYDVV